MLFTFRFRFRLFIQNIYYIHLHKIYNNNIDSTQLLSNAYSWRTLKNQDLWPHNEECPPVEVKMNCNVIRNRRINLKLIQAQPNYDIVSAVLHTAMIFPC